jgi:hypothetical protein
MGARVTVGVPVRDGAATLARALDTVIGQDFRELDIVVSDNASSDATPEIVAEYRSRDRRIRAVRHETPLRALDHFHWLKDQARGELFMWAAHDDARSLDYVSRLVRGLDEHPRAVLAFGDLFVSDEPCGIGEPRAYDFDTCDLGLIRRVRKTVFGSYADAYGLWRTADLQRIPCVYTAWWPDMPLMTAAACLGEFVHVSGPRFSYHEVFKSHERRAAYQDLAAPLDRVSAMLELQRAMWGTCNEVAGRATAALAVSLLAGRHATELPGFVIRRLQRLLAP